MRAPSLSGGNITLESQDQGPGMYLTSTHRYFGLQVNLGNTILYFLCLLSNIFILLSLSLLTSNISRYFSFVNHRPSVIPPKVTTIFLFLSSKVLTMVPVQSSLQDNLPSIHTTLLTQDCQQLLQSNCSVWFFTKLISLKHLLLTVPTPTTTPETFSLDFPPTSLASLCLF